MTLSFLRSQKRIRGLTLVEVMCAIGLLGMVFMATAFIASASARQVKSLYGDARTQHRAHLVLQRIRYKLCMGMAGTPRVSDDGRTLRYVDPNNGGVVSMITLREGSVYYYSDDSEAASTPGQGIGPIADIEFVILGPGNAVRIVVTSLQKFAWKLDRPFTLSAEVTLRN